MIITNQQSNTSENQNRILEPRKCKESDNALEERDPQTVSVNGQCPKHKQIILFSSDIATWRLRDCESLDRQVDRKDAEIPIQFLVQFTRTPANALLSYTSFIRNFPDMLASLVWPSICHLHPIQCCRGVFSILYAQSNLFNLNKPITVVDCCTLFQ